MLVLLLLTLFLLVAGLLWFAVPFALRLAETRKLRKLCASKRAIVLTYDDGPSQTVSPALSALLTERQVPATFFLLGGNAAAHPEMVRKLHHDGHEIGSHTRDHSNAWKTSPGRALRDVQAGRAVLRELGVPTRLFRPPFGKTTLASLVQRLLARLRFAYWTVDTRDSWDRRPVDDILSEIETGGGGVVLMHDFDAPTRGPDPTAHRDYVLRLTRALVDFAEDNGFTLMRFSDLFDGRTGAGGR